MNQAYLNTRFVADIDLSLLPDSFYIVTAYNPMDERLPEEENKKNNEELRTKICDAKFLCIPIVGASSDFSHKEPSFLTDAPLEDVLCWARIFNQRAIFSVEKNHLSIIPCGEREHSWDLGPFDERTLPHKRVQNHGSNAK